MHDTTADRLSTDYPAARAALVRAARGAVHAENEVARILAVLHAQGAVNTGAYELLLDALRRLGRALMSYAHLRDVTARASLRDPAECTASEGHRVAARDDAHGTSSGEAAT